MLRRAFRSNGGPSEKTRLVTNSDGSVTDYNSGGYGWTAAYIVGTLLVLSLLSLSIATMAKVYQQQTPNNYTTLLTDLHAKLDNASVVSMDLISKLENVPDTFQNTLVLTPSDSVHAVGPETVITAVNSRATIIDKKTQTIVSSGGSGPIFNESANSALFDPWITYDNLSERFFMTALELCISRTILTTTNATYTLSVAAFGPQSINGTISGNVVLANPPNGCTAPTNAAALAGNIALVMRGTCAFTTKTTVMQAAGASAVIIYNNIPTKCGPGIGGTGNFTIPTLGMKFDDGSALAPLTPFSGTLADAPGGKVYNSFMHIAVSRNSNPRTVTQADWYGYNSIFNYSTWLADFPKHGVDTTRFYITTGDYKSVNGSTSFLQDRIIALNKTAILNFLPSTQLWEATFPSSNNHTFMAPAQIRGSINNAYQRMYFISTVDDQQAHFFGTVGLLRTISKVRIYKTNPYGSVGTPVLFSEISIPPMTFVNGGQLARQPNATRLELLPALYSAVVRNNSLFASFAWYASSDRTVVRWFEFDLSDDIVYNRITLKQYGDVAHEDGTSSLFYPAIDVDVEGNMGISFSVSGINRHLSHGYTGRHHTDPLGTVRYPILYAHVGNHSSRVGTALEIESNVAKRNRWGDYTMLMVDPVDGKTFYTYGQITDAAQAGLSSQTVNDAQWSTVLGKFRIDKVDTTKTRVINPTAPRAVFPGIATSPPPSTSKRSDAKRDEHHDHVPKSVSWNYFCHLQEPMTDRCAAKMEELAQITEILPTGKMDHMYYYDE